MRLDLFYVLSSLWSTPPNPQVCTTLPSTLPSARHDIAWSPGLRAGVTAFVNVHVVPMDTERVLRSQTVLVEEGRIAALGPSSKIKVPAGAVRIDGRGKYLMPGLADMHAHSLYSYRDETYDQLMYRQVIRLAHGVTSFRAGNWTGMQTHGREYYYDHRYRHFETADLLLPRMYSAIPLDIRPRSEAIDAFLAASRAKGYHYLTVNASWVDPTRTTTRSADSLLMAARRLGIPVADHSHPKSFAATLALGAYGGSVEHLYALHDLLFPPGAATASAAEFRARAAEMQRAGVWITPTLYCIEQNQGRAGLVSSQYDVPATRRFVNALQEAGAKLLLGADADGPLRASPSVVHEELAALVGAGLTPYQALLTGTRHPAEYLRLLDSAGTVAVGKWADLVLLSGNPLADIQHVREPVGVMIRGRWLDRAALDDLLFDAPTLAFWFQAEVKGGFGTRVPTDEQMRARRAQLMVQTEKFLALADSLAMVKWLDAEPLVQQLTVELGGIRALLTPAQRASFDPKARVWQRVWTRRGFREVAVPGVTLTP